MLPGTHAFPPYVVDIELSSQLKTSHDKIIEAYLLTGFQEKEAMQMQPVYNKGNSACM